MKNALCGFWVFAFLGVACQQAVDRTDVAPISEGATYKDDPRLSPPTVLLDENGDPFVESPEDQAATEAMMAEFPTIPGDTPVVFDDMDAPMQAQADEHAEINGVEKNGSITALMGWGIKGNLVYQRGDGVIDGPYGRAHCFTFGLDCDDTWHTQARDIYYDNYEDWLDEVQGICADASALGSAWNPCLFPKWTGAPNSSGRNWKWRLVDTNCGNATAKAHMRSAIQTATAWYDSYGGINFSETTGTDWNIIFTCGSIGDGNTIARAGVRGNIYLEAAVADTSQPLSVYDQCETPVAQIPGGGPGAIYTSSLDMIYTYKQGEIRLNMTKALSFINCTTSSTLIRRAMSNFVKHEMGHIFGFQHNTFSSDKSVAVMRSGQSATCADVTNYVMGLPQAYLYAMENNEQTHTGFGLDVYDEDISCYRPVRTLPLQP